MGRKLAREESSEQARFRKGGYLDEFGWHQYFCMSCHGWKDSERLKYAAAANGLNHSSEHFAFQTTADLALTATLIGGDIVVAKQVTTQGMRTVQLAQHAQRPRVLANIAESQAARASSGISVVPKTCHGNR